MQRNRRNKDLEANWRKRRRPSETRTLRNREASKLWTKKGSCSKRR